MLIVVLGWLRAARYISLGPDAAARHERLFDLRRDASHQYFTALKYLHTGRIERPYSSHPETRRPYLDTVLIDTLHVNEATDVIVEMVWRAAFLPPRRLKDATIIVTEESPS